MHIVQFNHQSTKCYIIESKDGLLLFDVGWPDRFSEFRDSIKANGFNFKDIKYFMVSHFHIDHAGLAGQLLENGLMFVVFENQVKYIDEMEQLIARNYSKYCMINKNKISLMKIDQSRNWLKSIGVNGEVIQVFGHQDQSVVLILDTGEALIGDLPVIEEYDELVKIDWKNIKSMNAKLILPAHANDFEL